MALATKKYKEAIIHLCNELGGEIRGKVKLAKLLYFLDFDNYEKNHKSITGDIYHRLPMGPVPDTMTKIIEQLEKSKKLEIKHMQEKVDYNPTEIYKCKSKADLSVFSKEEMEILNRTIATYGHLNGKQLETLSHAEAPYIATEERGEIAYELAYYRGTDFKNA
jgi:uncharacterized phage-associated protein